MLKKNENERENGKYPWQSICFLIDSLYQRQGQPVEYDFKGGAGAAPLNQQVVHKDDGTKYVEEESSETELENDLSDDKNNTKDLKEATPVRHSERTAGKTFKYWLSFCLRYGALIYVDMLVHMF